MSLALVIGMSYRVITKAACPSDEVRPAAISTYLFVLIREFKWIMFVFVMANCWSGGESVDDILLLYSVVYGL